jgi:hypothetical protein
MYAGAVSGLEVVYLSFDMYVRGGNFYRPGEVLLFVGVGGVYAEDGVVYFRLSGSMLPWFL